MTTCVVTLLCDIGAKIPLLVGKSPQETTLKVKLYIRIKQSDGNRPYCEPVFAANQKLRPGYALVNGTKEHHPEGAYGYLSGQAVAPAHSGAAACLTQMQGCPG